MGLPTSYSKLWFISFTLVLVISCRATKPEVERGGDYEFQFGHPEIRVSALGVLDQEDSAIVQIATEIIYSSLINKYKDDRRYSEIEIEYSVTSTDSDFNKTIKRELTIESTPGKVSGESFTLQEEVSAIPGNFEVLVSVSDKSSEKETIRIVSAFIPDPENPVINLSPIQLHSKDEDQPENAFFPVTTYDVPSRMDSLRFIFQITNKKSNEPLTIQSRLLRFHSDTTIARPMNHREYSASSIQYKGIDYDDYIELASGIRLLTQDGSVSIEFTYPTFERGNYRFEVETTSTDGKPIKKARDFAIKSYNYPEIKNVLEFAYPLYYLMEKKQYEELISIENKKEMKSEIDRFWLSHIGDPKTAKSVIELYYNRVEESNKLFSNYKEGWKTDLGMMYILFGPPWYEKSTLDQLSWGYSFNYEDPSKNFYFYSPKIKSEYYPFKNYILQRSSEYYSVYYQQIDLWLSGVILIRNL